MVVQEEVGLEDYVRVVLRWVFVPHTLSLKVDDKVLWDVQHHSPLESLR
jgi:hypothetical protein